MSNMKRIAMVLSLVGLSISAFYAIKNIYGKQLAVSTATLSEITPTISKITSTVPDKTFQDVQAELNKDYCKKKVVSRFEVVEGLRGLEIKDITLTLLEYSCHRLNDSGRQQAFVKAQCRIDINKYEMQADMIREHERAVGRRGPVNIQLPDKERTILGVIDAEKEELITLAALPKSVRPIVQFAELQKNKPEYIIFTVAPSDQSSDREVLKGLITTVFGFDPAQKTYSKVLEVKTDRGADKYSISWSDWINDTYRELIISMDSEVTGSEGQAAAGFKNKKEYYTWVNDKELALVERVVDGQIAMSNRGKTSSSPSDVMLKDGELYVSSGAVPAARLTSTGGKIESFLVSPDKHYVACAVAVGVEKVYGLDDDEGDPRTVHHIIVVDLDQRKQLTEIGSQSKGEPFIFADKWISNEKLIIMEADGFATGMTYVYNAELNVLRMAEISEIEERVRSK